MQYKIIALLVSLLVIGGVVAGLLIKIKSLNAELLESRLYLSECKSAIELQNKEIEQHRLDTEAREQRYQKDIEEVASKYRREENKRLEVIKANGDKRDFKAELTEIERLYKQFFKSEEADK